MTVKRIGTSFLSIALCGVLALGNGTMSLAVSATENDLPVMHSIEDPPYTLSEMENRDYQQWLLENEEILPEPTNTSMSLLAVADSEIEYSGICGTNVKYCFEDGTLTISVIDTSSAGTMDDFVDGVVAPWENYRSEIETIIITDGVGNVGFNAFHNCINLTTVDISESVKQISYYAFYRCRSLVSVTTEATTINQLAFSGCTSLAEVNLTNTITMAYKAFGDCTSLESVAIPSTIKNLRLPFLGCTSLRAVEIPESNEYYCSMDGVIFNEEKTELIFYPPARNGESYILPETVVSVYERAFANSLYLSSIIFPENCKKFGKKAFENSNYINKWWEEDLVYKYHLSNDANNNEYLIINGVLLDVKIEQECVLDMLDFTKNYSNGEDTRIIALVDLQYPEKFTNVTKIIADQYTDFNHECLSETAWYKADDINIIYNNAVPELATYKMLYSYRAMENEFHAEEFQRIGNYAFSKWNGDTIGMTIHLNSNNTIINRNAFGTVNINSIIVDGEMLLLEDLQIAQDEMETLNIQGATHYCIKDVNDFAYMLSVAVPVNVEYFEKLAYVYCQNVLNDLQIDKYKSIAQKINIVYNWVMQNYDYGVFVYPDEAGDLTDFITDKNYTKDFYLTHQASAHLLTTHGVCSSYTNLFNIFADLMDIESFYVGTSTITIDGITGNHAWNAVKVTQNSEGKNLWYYLDITWGESNNSEYFLFGQESVKSDSQVGYRLIDAQNNREYIDKLFPDHGYSNDENILSNTWYEPLITKSITISNYLSESYDVKLDYCEKLYSEISENGRIVSYNLFGETSFYENTGITVGENVVYTFENADSMSFSEDITGIYTVSEDYEISYSIQNTDGNISIELWDNETDYVSLQDTANVISYYTVEDNGVLMRYTESSRVALDDEFVLRFYDVNANLIATASQPVFSESYAHIADLQAAYKLSSGTSPTQSMITLETYQLGDVTTNGVVDGNDSVTLLKYLIGKYNFIQTGSTGNLLLGNGNITVNGDISANGTFTLNATDANINGQLSAATFVDGVTGNLNMNKPENDITITSDYVTAVFSEERMNQAFFNDDSLVTVDGNYENNDTNINLSEDHVVEGTATMNGNVNINSNFKAEGDIVINGDVQNTNGGVIYSTNGDITLDSNNVNFNGFIYAPNGTVTIKASNVTIKGTIIAEELIIEGNCVNFNVAALDSAVGNGSGLGDMTLTEFQLMLGDMDLNGVYELLDVVAINRKIQGLAA